MRLFIRLLFLQLLLMKKIEVKKQAYEHFCSLVEECVIGTFICDLSAFEFLNLKNHTRISLLNYGQLFLLHGMRLQTRRRVDRERLISNGHCQSTEIQGQLAIQRGENHPSLITCVIYLEFTIFHENDTSQPLFFKLPLHILDVNDHIPRFDQHTRGLRIEVDEDVDITDSHGLPTRAEAGSRNKLRIPMRQLAILPLAIDLDFGLNGTVHYSLRGQDVQHFVLQNRTSIKSNHLGPVDTKMPQLTLSSAIDLNYENKPEYRMLLIATDQCEIEKFRHTTQLPITIIVKDVNEYAPVYDFRPTEHRIPPLHASADLRIAMKIYTTVEKSQDMNKQDVLIIHVPENVPVGSRIYRIAATDPDVIMNAHSKVSSTQVVFTIATSADLNVRRHFRIDSNDGWIIVLHRFDYELGARSFKLPVVATDFGKPPKSSFLSIIVKIGDVNDEAPQIEVNPIGPNLVDQMGLITSTILTDNMLGSNVHMLTVMENSATGTIVAKISVVDRDTGPSGRVSCQLNYPPKSHIGISEPYDSHVNPRVAFELQPIESTPTVINPAFTMSSTMFPLNKDYFLRTTSAIDRETQESYLISIVCHDHGSKFSSTDTSTAYFERSLSSTSLLKIVVLDQNDNAPYFPDKQLDIYVIEDSPKGTLVTQLIAKDRDVHRIESQTCYRFATVQEIAPANLSQSQLNDLESHFDLEQITGWLKIGEKCLDREQLESYQLPIIAYDKEYPERTSLVWVNVHVKDANDNPPKLVGNSTFWLDEEDGSGLRIEDARDRRIPLRQMFVGHLKAEDADLGENASVIFRLYSNVSNIQSPDEVNVQWVLRPDGSLFVRPLVLNALDRERQDVYHIPIVLKDNSLHHPLSTTATITVSLRDRNDNTPQFLAPDSTHSLNAILPTDLHQSASDRIDLTENISPGSIIYTALATDPDDGLNGQIIYTLSPYEGFWQLVENRDRQSKNISSNSNGFIIDENSGEIRLNQILTSSLTSFPKRLVIFAQDRGSPPRRTHAFLYIKYNDDISSTSLVSTNTVMNSSSIKGYKIWIHHQSKNNDTLMQIQQRTDKQSSLISNRSRENKSRAHRKQTDHSHSDWDSEMMIGLGIGLVILILICLLLLVTYAIYGSTTSLLPHFRRSTPRRTLKSSTRNDICRTKFGVAAKDGNVNGNMQQPTGTILHRICGEHKLNEVNNYQTLDRVSNGLEESSLDSQNISSQTVPLRLLIQPTPMTLSTYPSDVGTSCNVDDICPKFDCHLEQSALYNCLYATGSKPSAPDGKRYASLGVPLYEIDCMGCIGTHRLSPTTDHPVKHFSPKCSKLSKTDWYNMLHDYSNHRPIESDANQLAPCLDRDNQKSFNDSRETLKVDHQCSISQTTFTRPIGMERTRKSTQSEHLSNSSGPTHSIQNKIDSSFV